MARTSHTNDVLTQLRIFFRVPQPSKVFEEMFGTEAPGKLREFTRDFMAPGTREYKQMVAATNDETRKTLSALVLLARVCTITPGDRTARDLYDAARLLIADYPVPPEKLAQTDLQQSSWLYAGLLNANLGEAHLAVISPKPGGLAVPAIICDTIRTACFAWCAYRGLEICPACGKPFAPNPERKQKFCSLLCGQKIFQRRYRRRVKAKSKKGARRR